MFLGAVARDGLNTPVLSDYIKKCQQEDNERHKKPDTLLNYQLASLDQTKLLTSLRETRAYFGSLREGLKMG